MRSFPQPISATPSAFRATEGRTLGEFRLQRLLDHGGMGEEDLGQALRSRLN